MSLIKKNGYYIENYRKFVRDRRLYIGIMVPIILIALAISILYYDALRDYSYWLAIAIIIPNFAIGYWLFRPYVRSDRWYRTNRCPRCGYPRRGATSAKCPECGRPWT